MNIQAHPVLLHLSRNTFGGARERGGQTAALPQPIFLTGGLT